MSMNSIENNVSTPPIPIPIPIPIPQQRYGNNNLIIQKPIPIQRSGVLKIRELRPWIRGFDITCIILQHLSRRTLKTQQEVELHSFLVADETAVCTLVIWENGQCYRGGDVVQITHGETRVHEEFLELTVNKNFGKIKIIDWDTMYYKEDEEPNLSGYNWVPDEKSPNTYVPMNTEKKFIDLETFQPYERPQQPYIIDSTQHIGFPPNIIKPESSMKQDDSLKMIKHEEDGIHGNMQYSSRDRGPPLHPSRYGSNGEQFGPHYDIRSQPLQSSRQQIPSQPLQQSDRPRIPSRRASNKFQRRDSWRDQDRSGDGMVGGGRQDRDNRDNRDNGRSRNPEINKRMGGGGGRNQPRNRGRDWDRSSRDNNRDRLSDRDREREWEFGRPPHTDLDRPAEDGELVNLDFGSIAAGLNRVDGRDSREGIMHKKPRIE